MKADADTKAKVKADARDTAAKLAVIVLDFSTALSLRSFCLGFGTAVKSPDAGSTARLTHW